MDSSTAFTSQQIVEVATAGIASGVLSAWFGIGGGIILAPLLGLILHCGQHQAQGLTLALLLLPLGFPAAIQYHKAGIEFSGLLVAALIAAFLPGAAGGAWLAHRISSAGLRFIFSGALVWMAYTMTFGKSGDEKHPARTSNPAIRQRLMVGGLVIGFAAGVSSGALGIGGGIVVVPLLMRMLEASFSEARMTSLVMMLPPIGLPAVVIYANEQGGLPWDLIAIVAATFAVGTWTGARLSSGPMGRSATLAMAGFMLLLAGSMIYKVLNP